MAIAATTLAAEVRRLRSDEATLTTIDGAIVMPTERGLGTGQSGHRSSTWRTTGPFRWQCDDASDWHDLPVTECYSTEAAAEAARWQT